MLLFNLSAAKEEKAVKEFKEMKVETQRRLRDTQTKWWEWKAQALHKASDVRDSKTMYQLLKEIYGPRQMSFAPLRSIEIQE